MGFKVGDKVKINGKSIFGVSLRDATGVIKDFYHDPTHTHNVIVKVGNDPDYMVRPEDLELIKENNVSDTKTAANALREAAADLRIRGLYSAAYRLEIKANELDPSPIVSVRHDPITINRVTVQFDKKADATTISHFLWTVQNKVDDVYRDDPDKQNVIRAFIDAWHGREGK